METLTEKRQREMQQAARRNAPAMRRLFWAMKAEQANNVVPIRKGI